MGKRTRPKSLSIPRINHEIGYFCKEICPIGEDACLLDDFSEATWDLIREVRAKK